MDRFVPRIPKPLQNAVIDQIRSIQELWSNSSKQASAEKISYEFKQQYFLECKWLQKEKRKQIMLQGLLTFSGWMENETFTCDWSQVMAFKKSIFNDITKMKVTKNA